MNQMVGFSPESRRAGMPRPQLPTTSSFAAGVPVPMPTLPLLSLITESVGVHWPSNDFIICPGVHCAWTDRELRTDSAAKTINDLSQNGFALITLPFLPLQ